MFIGLWYVSYECFLNNLYQFIQTIFIHWVFFQVYFGKLLLFLELEIPKFLTFQTYIGITALLLTYIISTQLFFLLPISPIFLSDLPLQPYNLNWSLILDISHFYLLNESRETNSFIDNFFLCLLSQKSFFNNYRDKISGLEQHYRKQYIQTIILSFIVSPMQIFYKSKF